MKKVILTSIIILLALTVNAQFTNMYVTGDSSLRNLGNFSGNTLRAEKDSIKVSMQSYIRFFHNEFRVKRTSSIFNDGVPTSIIWSNSNGEFRRSPLDSLHLTYNNLPFGSTTFLTQVVSNGLYYPLSSNPNGYLIGITSGQIIGALGYTPYNSTSNPLNFLTSVPAQSFSSLTGKPTTLSGYGITDPIVITSGSYSNPSWITSLAYSKLTGVPAISIPDYTHTVNTAGGAGQAVFYLTSDKTSTGAALYSTIDYISPQVNNPDLNYAFGWTYNASTKALTVTAKASVGLNISLLGLTLLGIPSPAANGVPVSLLVKGH